MTIKTQTSGNGLVEWITDDEVVCENCGQTGEETEVCSACGAETTRCAHCGDTEESRAHRRAHEKALFLERQVRELVSENAALKAKLLAKGDV